MSNMQGKGDMALHFIKTKCANITADDKYHFHHLFTSIRIMENESATSYFCNFTFEQTEAEGAGNKYTGEALVNLALARLATSKNSLYDTAVQLFQLERDSGKQYTLEDLEHKFFTIDKKQSREQTLTHLAAGNAAHSHKRGTGNSNNSNRPPLQCPESANVASSPTHTQISCVSTVVKRGIKPMTARNHAMHTRGKAQRLVEK
jgi:hypothetical protein